MTKHGTREAWLAARLEGTGEALTRRSDELAHGGELPWVRVDEEYGFETK